MSDVEGLASRLGGIRDLIREARPILAARRLELGPLLASLGQDVFEEPRPPLTERALAEFESTHAVCLPADYRAFLVEVGNGGPGPGFGMPELRPPLPRTALDSRRSISFVFRSINQPGRGVRRSERPTHSRG